MSIRRDDTILHIILLIVDLIGSLLSIIIAFAIRYRRLLGISKNWDCMWLVLLILVLTVAFNIFITPVKKYISRGVFAELTDIAIRQTISIVATVVVLYLAHNADIFSRLVFTYYIVISIIVVWVFRLITKSYLKKYYKNSDAAIRVIVVADKARLPRIMDVFNNSNEWNKIITKTYAIEDVRYQAVIDYATRYEVDEAFVSIVDTDDKEQYQEFLSRLVGMGIKVDVDINQFELDIQGNKYLDEIGKFAIVSVSRNSISLSQQFLKRLMDIAGGLIGTVVFAAAFVIIGLLIKIDSDGPVIFVQKRVGKNGRIFDFYKFRSMYKDAEARKKELMAQNEVTGLMFKMEDDPRITGIGRFIRKTSIDELPQFINVLRGDMSLVGTRPPTVDEYEHYKPWHKSRLSMKPGITGLWQISGRSDIKDFEEVVKLDMEYIDNWSLGKDIKILLKTIIVVLVGKGSR